MLILTGTGFATITPEATLTSPAATPFSGFGSALSLHGSRLAVAAPWHSRPDLERLHSGSVYIFDNLNGQWTLAAELTAGDGDNEDFFGRSLALDGDRLLVGAPAESDAPNGKLFRGAAYVFELDSGVWSQVARLDAGNHEQGFAFFGSSVALEGTTLAIGAPGDEHDFGAVQLFELSGGSWLPTVRLEGDDPGGRFGSSIELDGDTLIVGERGGGSWRVYRRNGGTWTEAGRTFGNTATFADGIGAGGVAGTAARVVVGAPGDDTAQTGGAHFFHLDGGTWQLEEITGSASTALGDRFGAAVAIDGHLAVIGAPGSSSGGQSDAGAAFLFDRSPTGDWQEALSLSGGAIADQRFGSAVVIDGDVIAVGAPGYPHLESGDGRVSIYRLEQVARFSASPAQGCAPLQVTFTDSSIGNIVTRSWDVDGDGITDYINPGPTLQHTYTTPGTYDATLTVVGPSGSDVETHEILVASGTPSADFSAEPITGEAPLQVAFTDLSSGEITERRWDFDGDGVIDVAGNLTQAQHTFTTPGTYSPKLEVIGECGSDIRERAGYVQVTAPSGPAIQNPSFEANGTAIHGFSGRVDQGNPIAVWQVSDPAKAGRNTDDGWPYYNNGIGPDGQVAAFLKDATISQTVSGFQAGTSYRLTFHVNGRAGYPTPQMVVRLGGQTLLNVAVPPRETADSFSLPFHIFQADITPGAGSHLLEIEQTAGAQPGLVIDFVEIEETPPAPPLPVIQNPSFEANGTAIHGFSGRVDQGNPIAVWQVSDPAKAGRNTDDGWPYYNNGIGPDGQVAAFLKDATISQTVSGFQAGVTYRLTFHVNGRAGYPTPQMVARLGGQTLLNVAVPPREAAGSFNLPFHVFQADITPGAGSHLLEIEQTGGGFPGLVIDFVEISVP